jgi:hypothetical protein
MRWHPGIPLNRVNAGQTREQEDVVNEQGEGQGKQASVTQQEYYAFCLHPQPQRLKLLNQCICL